MRNKNGELDKITWRTNDILLKLSTAVSCQCLASKMAMVYELWVLQSVVDLYSSV